MDTSKSYTAHVIGLIMETITVEVDTTTGLNSFSIVGLGDRSVEEAKDRISAAIKNSGYKSPKQRNQKVIISLAPADIRKEGSSFDLAMAIAYLASVGDIDSDFENKLFIGELALDGKIRKVHGLLPILIQANLHGFTTAFVPKENQNEACLAQNIIIYAVSSLSEIIDHITRRKYLEPLKKFLITNTKLINHEHDISFIRGNETAKRALEIAVAGCHNIVLYGPPGTGKTMLAQSIMSILPRLSYEQSIEVTSIHSVAKTLDQGLIQDPPFRSPHHTASNVSILGGGSIPKPGEITLAHRGVLFLDEFPEFDRNVIEGLRQPLEDKVITISRIRGSVTFPAQCILIASMNPCKCGKGKDNGCTCTNRDIESYKRKISSSILDRIDIWIHVNKVDYKKLSSNDNTSEKSFTILERINMARKIQEKRFKNSNIQESNKKIIIKKYFNSEMNTNDIDNFSFMNDDARKILSFSAEKLELSGRAFHRVIKVARTIADIDQSEYISKKHILEALQYRNKIK